MNNRVFTLLIIVLIVGVPIALSFLLEQIFVNLPIGDATTWITFAGNYIGAIIGASVVYFVARLQIQKQHEQQIEAIKLENIESTKRGMRNFHITNKLKKIEEMLIGTEHLMVVVKDLYNDLILFGVTMETLEKEEADDRELEFEQRIDILKDEYNDHYDKALTVIYKLRTLTNYVPTTMKYVSEIDQELEELFAEVKNCYRTKNYKKYIAEEDKEQMPGEFGEAYEKIVDFNVNVLQKELARTLEEIKTYIELP